MPFLGLASLQILLAFVSATILCKLCRNKIFLRWVAGHNFTCWLAPSNQELTALKKGGSSESKRARHRTKSRGSPSTSKDELAVFKISAASLDTIKLSKSTLRFTDFILLYSSDDLEWMVDLAFMSFFNFLLTEFAFYWLSLSNETNLSQLWITLVITYSVINLVRLTRSYFVNQSSGERSICIVSVWVFMFIAMLVLVVDETKLEFGLETAYKSFNKTATAFIKKHDPNVNDPKAIRKPMSFVLIKFSLAVLCAFTGMVFTFPGFRYAQLHKDLLDNPNTSILERYLTMFNFASPIMVILLWVKPLTRDIVLSLENYHITDATFDSFRIYFIIIVSLIKFFTLPQYVSTFLKTVHPRLKRLRRRGGSTTNKEIQMTVSSIYNYVNVVIIQYLLPILMSISTVLLFKSLAGHSWLDIVPRDNFQNLTISSERISSTTPLPTTNDEFGSPFESDMNIATSRTITLADIKGVFTRDVCQGVMGFATWWLQFSWFLNSLAGIVYHTYFMQ